MFAEDLHGDCPFPASALPISLEEDGHARSLSDLAKNPDFLEHSCLAVS